MKQHYVKYHAILLGISWLPKIIQWVNPHLTKIKNLKYAITFAGPTSDYVNYYYYYY